MNFHLVGTEYGGWLLNLDLVPHGSTIISAGVGEDISFDSFLIHHKGCKVVGVDPTPKSHRFIESHVGLENFMLVKKALTSKDNDAIALYKNKNNDHVSESILNSHDSILQSDSYYASTVTLPRLFEEHNNISVVKMDIEGAEYEVIETIQSIPDSVRQLCVEFHHFCTNKTIQDTVRCVEVLGSLGFENYLQKPSIKPLVELTFWR
tara:strand:- start:5135 stop:5755 length:621 start_codon:yes stop_codon:yes gene_type:complete